MDSDYFMIWLAPAPLIPSASRPTKDSYQLGCNNLSAHLRAMTTLEPTIDLTDAAAMPPDTTLSPPFGYFSGGLSKPGIPPAP